MIWAEYTEKEIMKMNPSLENNQLIIRKDGKVYKAIMKNNNKWKLYEVKEHE